MQITRTIFRKAGVLGAGSALMAAGITGGALAGATPAFAASAVSNTYSCSALGQSAPSTFAWASNAPSSIATGATYTDALTESPVAVPSSQTAVGITLTVVNISAITIVASAPTGTTLNGTPTLSGGSGAGSSSIATSGNTVTVTIPGPVAGGATYTAPTINLPLKVTAASGSHISDAFPTEAFSVSVTGAVTTVVSTSCAPAASPSILATTSVTAASGGGGSTGAPVGAVGGLVIAALLGGGFFAITRVRRSRALEA